MGCRCVCSLFTLRHMPYIDGPHGAFDMESAGNAKTVEFDPRNRDREESFLHYGGKMSR